jgi:hypothetical protein
MSYRRVVVSLGMLAICMGGLLSYGACATAQEKAGTDKSSNTDGDRASKEAQPPKPKTISDEQEKSILAFVSKHDSSLHGLLGNLKTSRPKDYQKALVDLNRLAQVRRNRPHAYDLEVKKWQAQSKIQVLAAKLTMNPNPETRKQLRLAIAERADLELQVLRADREFMAKRLEQLDEQIAAGEATRDSRVQQHFERATAAARRMRTSKDPESPKKRPAPESDKPSDSPEKPEKPTEKPTEKPSNPASKREGARS